MNKLLRNLRDNWFAKYKHILKLQKSIEKTKNHLGNLYAFANPQNTFSQLKSMLSNAYVPPQYYEIFYNMLRYLPVQNTTSQ